MELKSNARRTRVFVAALALGLVLGAYGYLTSPTASSDEVKKSAPKTLGGDERQSPGGGAGLRPVPPGKSPAISMANSAGAAKVAVAEPTYTQLQTAWKQSTIRLTYLETCQKSAKCSGFDDSEPASYDLDVRRQQAQELEDFTRIALAWQAENGGDLPEEAQKIARYFLETGNDDVKEAALKLIDHAPLSEENVRASLMAVESSASGPLMTVLLKGKLAPAACSDESYASMCRSFISHTARIGGEGVQKAFARNSLNIMTEKTIGLFTQIERRSSPRSTNALMYRLNREEFERFQRGG